MTREEYKTGNGIVPSYQDTLVDRIFDDFESRTCENCKYSEYTDDGGYDKYCTMLQDYMYEFQSCNKFERKTDGDV